MSFDPVITSFFAPAALAQRIEIAYGIQDARCQLISATLRDVYLVESRAGRHILLVYRHDQCIPCSFSWAGIDNERRNLLMPALGCLSMPAWSQSRYARAKRRPAIGTAFQRV